MSNIRIRKWLTLGSGLQFLLAVAVLAFAWFYPIEVPLTESRATVIERSDSDKEVGLTDHNIKSIFSRRFQQPLFDPPPAPPPAPVKPPPTTPPNIRLIATVTEPENSRAMVYDVDGTLVIRSVGEKIPTAAGVAELSKVASDHIVVEYKGQSFTITRKE